jgi:hypothetical protein
MYNSQVMNHYEEPGPEQQQPELPKSVYFAGVMSSLRQAQYVIESAKLSI